MFFFLLIDAFLFLLFSILILESLDDNYGKYKTNGTGVFGLLILGLAGLFFIIGKQSFLTFAQGVLTWSTLYWVGAYLFIGILWSFYKWFQFVKWIVSKTIPERPKEELLEDLALSKHWEKIGTWILWWPISILRFLVYDFLTSGRRIAKIFSEIYNSITKDAIK